MPRNAIDASVLRDWWRRVQQRTDVRASLRAWWSRQIVTVTYTVELRPQTGIVSSQTEFSRDGGTIILIHAVCHVYHWKSRLATTGPRSVHLTRRKRRADKCSPTLFPALVEWHKCLERPPVQVSLRPRGPACIAGVRGSIRDTGRSHLLRLYPGERNTPLKRC